MKENETIPLECITCKTISTSAAEKMYFCKLTNGAIVCQKCKEALEDTFWKSFHGHKTNLIQPERLSEKTLRKDPVIRMKRYDSLNSTR